MTLRDSLIDQFERLDSAQQQRLLNFARILAQTPQRRGESGTDIIRAVGFFDPHALDEIEAAIESLTEDVDWNEWK